MESPQIGQPATPQPGPDHWSHQILGRAETFIYSLIALFLTLGALSLVGASAYHFAQLVGTEGVERAVLRALEDLLLVIMLVEITHTVGISLREKRLICEPFLIVGVIAAVRRMLIITAEMATPSEGKEEIFKLFMLELGILTATILALCAGIFLLRKIGRGTREA